MARSTRTTRTGSRCRKNRVERQKRQRRDDTSRVVITVYEDTRRSDRDEQSTRIETVSMHGALCVCRAPVMGVSQRLDHVRSDRAPRVARVQVDRPVTCMAGRKASNSSRGPRQQVSSGGGQPAWKRFAKKDKALGKRAEATLEMIWSKTAWLTDEHIQGMWDEHRVRKDVVVAWFAEKRRESRRQKKTGAADARVDTVEDEVED